MDEQKTSWYVYMVRTADGALYTGITKDPQRRLQEHSEGRRGARSLRGKGPLSMVWQQPVADRSLASRLEAHIKKQNKAFKEQVVSLGLSLSLEAC